MVEHEMKRKPVLASLLHGAAIVALLATPTVAYAADDADDDGETRLEEIIVTSRKKQEMILEVPMNIAAVSAQEILKRNLINKEDAYRTVAGAASPRGELILRGLSGGNDSSPGTTSAWTDDIPYDFSDLFDVERVEVLRGPQGTLYGSNAIGGTVRIITNKPNLSELEAFGSMVFKSEKNRPDIGTNIYGGLNVPIIEDQLALRVIGNVSNQTGKILNTNTGDFGDDKYHFIRAQMMWQPNDGLNVNLSYVNENSRTSGYDYADRSQPGYYYEAVLTENPDATYGYDVYLNFPECEGERAQCRVGAPVGEEHSAKFSVWETLDPWAKNTLDLFGLRVEKSNLIDGIDMIYAGSYRKQNHASLDNWSRNDANDLFRAWIINDDGYKEWTHEVRLQTSGDGPFDLTVGAFYDKVTYKSTPDGQWEYIDADNRTRAIAEYLWGYYWGLGDPTQIGLDLYGDGTKNYNYNQQNIWNRELALFGEASYTLETESAGRFEFTAGLRYYDLKDHEEYELSGIWIGDEIQEVNNDGAENGTRKKFSVSWMPNDNLSVFAVYSEGYRPGGNNGPTAPQDCLDDENIGAYTNRYNSDQIKNYEVGVKGLLFDRRFQFSSAIYQIDWTGVQTSVYMPSCGFSYTANAASAQSKGLEFESTTLVTDSLKFTLNAAYTDSKMTSDADAIGAHDGDDMTMVPKYNFYAALDQEMTLFEREASVRLEYAGYGKYKSHFNVRDEDISPAYEVLNISGSLQINENARISLHVNNLLNTEIITYKRNQYRSDYSLGNQYVYYGDERTFALRLDFQF
ncbi:MAG: TonB-dependent receptor [Alphaproteobacteria bacterium]|nr:MAG: TonB-dependent receptor [Alphaproteobacteria bacterium]